MLSRLTGRFHPERQGHSNGDIPLIFANSPWGGDFHRRDKCCFGLCLSSPGRALPVSLFALAAPLHGLVLTVAQQAHQTPRSISAKHRISTPEHPLSLGHELNENVNEKQPAGAPYGLSVPRPPLDTCLGQRTRGCSVLRAHLFDTRDGATRSGTWRDGLVLGDRRALLRSACLYPRNLEMSLGWKNLIFGLYLGKLLCSTGTGVGNFLPSLTLNKAASSYRTACEAPKLLSSSSSLS